MTVDRGTFGGFGNWQQTDTYTRFMFNKYRSGENIPNIVSIKCLVSKCHVIYHLNSVMVANFEFGLNIITYFQKQ